MRQVRFGKILEFLWKFCPNLEMCLRKKVQWGYQKQMERKTQKIFLIESVIRRNNIRGVVNTIQIIFPLYFQFKPQGGNDNG